jgi:hypothetical protein
MAKTFIQSTSLMALRFVVARRRVKRNLVPIDVSNDLAQAHRTHQFISDVSETG